MQLFEHQHIGELPKSFDSDKCERILQDIWESRYSFGLEDESRYKFNKDSEQQFIKFTRKGLNTGKYAGVIKTKDEIINIYPKIFKPKETINLAESDPNYSRYVFSHILWWMTYSKKIRLPKSFSSYNTSNCDFLEVLIYFFAYYTEELVNNYWFNDYQLIEDDLSLVRGRIKFNDYISNIVRGNWHQIPCEFSKFQHDNLLNQIIRYVAKLLYPFTSEKRTKKLLDSTLHQLDEVSDVHVTINDCDKVILNPLFEEYAVVLDYCKMFISNSMVSSYKDDLSVFSFLVNTESIYEDFLYGFINKHKNALDIQSIIPQDLDSLAKEKPLGEKSFNVKMDYLIIKNDSRQIIADAKYKRIYREKSNDSKKRKNYGISNSDVFQMISYSYRKDINDVLLLYPSYSSEKTKPIIHEFDVIDSNDSPKIDLKAGTLNIINYNEDEFAEEKTINQLFKETETSLIAQLNGLFLN